MWFIFNIHFSFWLLHPTFECTEALVLNLSHLAPSTTPRCTASADGLNAVRGDVYIASLGEWTPTTPATYQLWFGSLQPLQSISLGEGNSDVKSTARGPHGHCPSLLGHGRWNPGLKGGVSSAHTALHLKAPPRRQEGNTHINPHPPHVPLNPVVMTCTFII